MRLVQQDVCITQIVVYVGVLVGFEIGIKSGDFFFNVRCGIGHTAALSVKRFEPFYVEKLNNWHSDYPTFSQVWRALVVGCDTALIDACSIS